MNTTQIENGHNLFDEFKKYSVTQLQELMDTAETREKIIFFNRLLNLKLAFEQEKVVGEKLL